MSYSHYGKMKKQLETKLDKLKKYERHNAPKKRSCGVSLKRCRRCGRIRAHISKYGLELCRQCFRDVATNIGFKKYS